jgi:tripartite-type tricarboxylate transporter receptor subunit TctC
MTTWFGLFVPKGTPREIVNRLNDAVRTMYEDPTSKGRLDSSFLSSMPLNAAQFAERVRNDYELWKKIIAAADLRPQ